MTAQPSLSRMQVVPNPVALPGKCMCCGAIDRESVDFGMSLDRYGAVYLCSDCIGEAARQLGYSSPTETMDSALRAEQSFNQYLNDNNLVVVSRELFDSVSDSVSNLHDAFSILRPVAAVEDVGEELGESEDSDSGDAGTSTPDSDAPVTSSGQKPRTNRQRRSSSVPSNSGDELDFDSGLG